MGKGLLTINPLFSDRHSAARIPNQLHVLRCSSPFVAGYLVDPVAFGSLAVLVFASVSESGLLGQQSSPDVSIALARHILCCISSRSE